MTDDFNFITFKCPDRDVTLTARLGPNGAKLTGGVGGLSTEALPRDTDAVVFGSHPPYGQTVDLLLDGFAARRSVEGDVHTLYVMGRARPGEERPPQVELAGNARRKDLRWLIADIEQDEANALSGRDDGVLTRMPVTVTLIQDTRAEAEIEVSPAKRARKRRRAKGRSGARRPVTARAGDTLAEVAKRHKVKGGAAALAKANGLRRGARLRAGQKLRLP